jgi:hypothetical protein
MIYELGRGKHFPVSQTCSTAVREALCLHVGRLILASLLFWAHSQAPGVHSSSTSWHWLRNAPFCGGYPVLRGMVADELDVSWTEWGQSEHPASEQPVSEQHHATKHPTWSKRWSVRTVIQVAKRPRIQASRRRQKASCNRTTVATFCKFIADYFISLLKKCH